MQKLLNKPVPFYKPKPLIAMSTNGETVCGSKVGLSGLVLQGKEVLCYCVSKWITGKPLTLLSSLGVVNTELYSHMQPNPPPIHPSIHPPF